MRHQLLRLAAMEIIPTQCQTSRIMFYVKFKNNNSNHACILLHRKKKFKIHQVHRKMCLD
ncbi:unnamed protein product [Trichobilharzia regenti]|nr:unnamed protein product [Trichobilharzia regenti]